MKKTIVAVLFISVLLPNYSSVRAAAITTLSGGASLRGNYDVTKRADDTTEDWRTYANIFLNLTHSRQAEKGGLSLRYATNYTYELKDGTSEWSDQRFNLNGWRDLSNRLRFNLSDTFIMTNDLWGEWLSPTATGISDEQPGEDKENTTDDKADLGTPSFSEQIGQNKFWSNYFSTSLAYKYAKNGTGTLGYNNRILEYDDPGRDNYMYNEPWINLSYGFSPQWNTSLSYNYIDAQFDISKDFIIHDAGFNLNYVHSVQDTLFGSIKYYEKNYESIEISYVPIGRSDYYAVRGNLGWTHNFSPQKTLSMSAGPEYLNFENEDPYTTAYFDLNYTSQFENGSWFIRANGGFDDRNFDGRDLREGVSEYQRVSTGVRWQVAKNLSASLGANIRTDDFLENPLNSNEKTYNAFANLSYRFSRWFYVSGRYWYIKNDAELNIDNYDEHRFFITLGASKELYRWIHQ